MQCDLCGTEGRLFKAIVEGTELTVSEECARLGRVLEEVKEPVLEKKKPKPAAQEVEEEIVQLIVSDFAEKIRRTREGLGLKHEEFAKKINEKESVVHKLEIGELEPSIKLAKKLEQMFGINLIEEYAESHKGYEKPESGEGLTIGDLIKIKKRA